MKVLVTGGAGFIGSVVGEALVEQGHEVVALDNLSHGHREAVHPEARFVECDLLEQARTDQVLARERPDAVVHMAAEALVDVSITDPGRFFRANVVGGVHLLDAVVRHGVERLVFSSTAAVYGEPDRVPIPEDAPHRPVNSYGESKLSFERMLRWYRRAHGLRHVSLRYFNACGATERFGEHHEPETHLIPILLGVALGFRDRAILFGSDYDTPDGSCIRDYVHVADLAGAHVLALEHIDELEARTYNLGNGSGSSNLEVVAAIREVTGHDVPVDVGPRRPGDPARLVADPSRIRSELGWVPDRPVLADMVKSAWAWRLEHPGGYEA
ncbi:MAG: UDP-glucose 4-epimerase GalE [Actinomycetota bacterium]|nr:UDP-glucose 4-epimerase GalE [Actinomycetota bacterium]